MSMFIHILSSSDMSKNFNKVKSYYDNGFWSKAKVHEAVVKKWITAEEYELIVGEPYTK